jgi:hypothetical protein
MINVSGAFDFELRFKRGELIHSRIASKFTEDYTARMFASWTSLAPFAYQVVKWFNDGDGICIATH